jgi:hypothetical protein
MKAEFTISHKRRMQDSVCVFGIYYNVAALIKSNPMLLWKAIHSRNEKYEGKAISLVRPAYNLLKNTVAKISPSDVALAEDKFEYQKRLRKLYKLEQKLRNEIKTGKANTSSSRFKKVEH